MAYDYAATADFNGDGKIDFTDYSRLARFWHEDESGCPIAPLPVPDGIIDSRDLAKLALHWCEGNNP